MQILGIAESTPKPENRLKNLFWPRVRYPEDVEYLGAQGYWVCVVIALFTFLVGASAHQALSRVPEVLYFYLAGVGIRRASRFAAASVFVIYLLNVITNAWVAHSFGIVSIIFLALLFSNVRGTWMAHRFATEHPLQETPPGTATFTDVLPRVIWPVGRWFYYVLTPAELIALSALLVRAATSH